MTRSPLTEGGKSQSDTTGDSCSDGFGPGVLFLDFDDVICLNKPYGGYDLFQMVDAPPEDLYQRIWHRPAVAVLLAILWEHRPRVVLTTSWLRMMEREGFEDLLCRTGLSEVSRSLHDSWSAPAVQGARRIDAIESWLLVNKHDGPIVVLDDELSGTGLAGSWLDAKGFVVLCLPGAGLQPSHIEFVRKALNPTAEIREGTALLKQHQGKGLDSREVQAARLGRWLREQVHKQSRTASDIGASLGVPEDSVRAVFAGDTNQTVETLLKVANELGIQLTLAPTVLPASWLYSSGPRVATVVDIALQKLRERPYHSGDSDADDLDSDWLFGPTE
ncbi:HAD domain-containing protein [Hydrogenophaga sp.]|uniref:HAD domain-containing protein n=1 Tax=Hydrogenophaga sp. TaxID=1904254 RepID=UPI00391C7328